MKNKKMLKMGATLALVGAIGVGGTLAYLSDSSSELKNTFVFTDENIHMKLDETIFGVAPNPNDESTRFDSTEGTQNYDKVNPSQRIKKDPVVRLYNTANAWVYLTVKDADDNVDVLEYNTGVGDSWEEITDTDEFNIPENTRVFKLKEYVPANTAANGFAEGAYISQAIFDEVKADATLDNKRTSADIVIKAAAVQHDGIEESEARIEGLRLLGITQKTSE